MIILCRWDVGELYEKPIKYCCKDVVKEQALPYCREHLDRLPIWPSGESK